jgi:peptide/nickel transport system substrate-binding protein
MTVTRRDFVAGALVGATALAARPRPPSAQPAPRRGGALNSTLWPEPPGLVIGIHLNAPTLLPGTKMFEGLLTYDFRMTPQPMLAESWEIAPDGLRYVFRLRRNVRWHDGRPFTADDVVFSCGEFLTEIHPRSRPVFQRTQVRALDPHSVEFTLREPFAPLIRNFDAIGAPILPAHLYRGTNFRQNPANAQPIGTGPFRFRAWQRGSHIHLVRNEDYWQEGKPYLDEIYYRLIPDSASRALAIENRQADLATQNDIELVDVQRLRALPFIETETRGWEWGAPIAWIEFNHRRVPFNDRRFRQAVMYALDRNFIRENIFFGVAKVATGPIHSSSPFYEPDVKQYPHDPRRAEALLDEMGLRRGAGGVRANVKLLGLPYGEVWNRINEYARQALRRVGIDVTIETSDVAGWGDRTRNWEFDMTVYFLTTLADPALGVARSYVTSSIRQGVLFGNHSGYSNRQVDDLFERAARSINENERKRLYSQVQKLLVEDVPVAWMVELEWPTFINRRLRNVVINALGPNHNFAEVHVAI